MLAWTALHWGTLPQRFWRPYATAIKGTTTDLSGLHSIQWLRVRIGDAHLRIGHERCVSHLDTPKTYATSVYIFIYNMHMDKQLFWYVDVSVLFWHSKCFSHRYESPELSSSRPEAGLCCDVQEEILLPSLENVWPLYSKPLFC